ncbi:MAG: hypothetical protein K6E29_04080 [Cyanobacteria bacterium RUI128]|nr:hypothetical protein [Cyanobacteria bacterium RUI128]
MNIAPVSLTNNNQQAFTAAPKSTASMFSRSNAFLNDFGTKYKKAKEDFIEKAIIKPVLQPVMNSKFMQGFADRTADMKNLPSHMSTAGSFVTTYFYANRTLKTLNKDEEQKKRAKVLATNQVMVTGLSTLGAYGLNDALGKFSKNLGYKFREANQGHAKLSTRMKGFDIAKQLLIFTMMYRYIAPVLVTPLASKVGKVYQNYKSQKNGEKQVAAEQAQPKPTVVNFGTEKPAPVNTTFGKFVESARADKVQKSV